MIGRKALVHRRDNGRTAAHAGLKEERSIVFPCQSEKFRAVSGYHLFIGGADAAAALKAAANIRIGKAGAADGFHNHGYLGIGKNRVNILDKECSIRGTGKIPHIQNVFDLDRLPSTAGDGRSIAAADFQDAASDGAEAHDCDFSHDIFPFLSFVCSFPIRKGTASLVLYAAGGAQGPCPGVLFLFQVPR